MTIHKTFQRRVHLRKSGHERLGFVMRSCRRLYNRFLQHWKDAYTTPEWSTGEPLPRTARGSVTYKDQTKLLTSIRKDNPDGWGSISVNVGRGVIRRRDRASQAFFKRVKNGETPGYPRFKTGPRWTIEIEDVSPSMVKQVGTKAHIRVKGLPAMEMRCKTPLPPSESLKAIRIKRYPTGVYASLSYEIEQEQAPWPRKGLEAVGIDMGVNKRATLSTGERVAPVRADREREKRLQRKASRAQDGGDWAKKNPGKKWSKGYRKRRETLAREQHRNKIRKRNETHRLTTGLVRRFGLIAVEALQIRNMTRSASGTMEEPGKGVAQKRGLNRSILEQTWGEFLRQLTYKAEWAGRLVVEVAPHHTSRRCSMCGVVDGSQRRGELYACRKCGLRIDADVNAAVNIRRKGEEEFRSRGSPVKRLCVPPDAFRAGKRAIQPALLPMDTG